jgi:low temperature requirement protein LtrA
VSDRGQAPEPPQHGAQRVPWLELFYDLVFVAAIVTFSDAVSEHPDLDVIAVVVAAFVAVWWIWLVTTLLANRFPVDDLFQRALVLVQMLLLLLIALNVGDELERHEGVVSILYALLCANVAVMHGRHARKPGISGALAKARRNEYAIACVPFLAAGFVDGTARYVLWGIGFATFLVPSLFYFRGAGREEEPLEEHHLVERLGLLTIIVCGEAFVKVALLSSEGRLDSLDIVVLTTLFVVIFAMWASYFDDVPDAGVSQGTGPLQGWFLGQLAFQVSVVGIAVGFGELVELHKGTSMDLDKTLLTFVPIITALVALAAISACTRRTPIAPLLALRLAAAVAFVVLAAITAAAGWFDVEPTAILLAVVALAQAGLSVRLVRRTRVPPR